MLLFYTSCKKKKILLRNDLIEVINMFMKCKKLR